MLADDNHDDSVEIKMRRPAMKTKAKGHSVHEYAPTRIVSLNIQTDQ